MRIHRPDVFLIIGGDKVRAEHPLQAGGTELRAIEFLGDAGTDFAPLILAASAHKPDVAIRLTDRQVMYLTGLCSGWFRLPQVFARHHSVRSWSLIEQPASKAGNADATYRIVDSAKEFNGLIQGYPIELA